MLPLVIPETWYSSFQLLLCLYVLAANADVKGRLLLWVMAAKMFLLLLLLVLLLHLVLCYW